MTFANLPVNAIDDGDLSWGDESVANHVVDIMDAPWFEDSDGFLYIAVDDCIEGADTPIAEALFKALWSDEKDRLMNEWEVDMRDVAATIGIAFIPKVLHRFDAGGLGFYHA